MGMLWGLVRTVMTLFAVLVAVLVVVDGSLLAKLLRKNN